MLLYPSKVKKPASHSIPAFEKLIRHFVDTAKQNLLKHKSITPYLFLLDGAPEEIHGLVIPYKVNSEEEKQQLVQSAKRMARENSTWGYIMVSEAWFLSSEVIPQGKLSREILPSKHPRRREAVMVTLETRNYFRSVIIPFEQHGDHIKFGDEKTFGHEYSFESRFSEILR